MGKSDRKDKDRRDRGEGSKKQRTQPSEKDNVITFSTTLSDPQMSITHSKVVGADGAPYVVPPQESGASGEDAGAGGEGGSGVVKGESASAAQGKGCPLRSAGVARDARVVACVTGHKGYSTAFATRCADAPTPVPATQQLGELHALIREQGLVADGDSAGEEGGAKSEPEAGGDEGPAAKAAPDLDKEDPVLAAMTPVAPDAPSAAERAALIARIDAEDAAEADPDRKGWRFDVRVMDPSRFDDPLFADAVPAVRVGWVTDAAEKQAYPGYGKHGYGYASVGGRRFHESKGEPYGRAYGVGDVVSCCLRFVGARDAATATISFYVNGEPQGVAFEAVSAADYFPAVSLYMRARAEVNFGPHFEVTLGDEAGAACRPMCDARDAEVLAARRARGNALTARRKAIDLAIKARRRKEDSSRVAGRALADALHGNATPAAAAVKVEGGAGSSGSGEGKNATDPAAPADVKKEEGQEEKAHGNGDSAAAGPSSSAMDVSS